MTSTVTADDAAQLLDRIQRDPAWYAGEILGVTLYDKQVELLEALRDCPQVSVVGANGTGKDYTTGGVAVLWWLHSHAQAKVIVIGPTHRQVGSVVFNEMRTAHAHARVPLGGRMFDTSRYQIDSERFAEGFATTDPYNIQGYHSPNLLAIITEAHNVPDPHIDAVRRLLPKRLLLTGNPFADQGIFYDSHNGKRAQWRAISISAFDSPNVKEGREVLPGLVGLEDIERLRQDWGEDNPLYIGGVLGQFPDSLQDTIISLSLIRAGIDRATDIRVEPGQPSRLISCDVARFGDDRTVIYERLDLPDGTVLARKLWSGQGADTMQVTGMCVRLRRERKAASIVVDDGGVGGGVVDRLRELREPVVAFNFGAKAKKLERFADAGTEAWYHVREWLEQGKLAIIDDSAAIGQMSSRKYVVTSDGRVRAEPKKDMKARGLKSPDDADALVMACYPHLSLRGITCPTSVSVAF